MNYIMARIYNVTSATNDNVLHHLDDGYQITQSSNKSDTLILRDKYCNALACIELFEDKIIKITGCKNKIFPSKYIAELVKFIRDYHYQISADVANDLGLSVVKIEDQDEIYHTVKELRASLLAQYMRNPKKVNIILNNYKKSKFIVPKTTQSCNLNLSHANIKTLIISKRANALIDFRDNVHIEDVLIQDGVIGAINLSRSSVANIKLGNNCRFNITMNYSSKCFNLKIGDVYSGVLDIKDSCFHKLNIGYYCYANIKLSENWGEKNINIGSSFRGNLIVDSVYVKHVNIGDDCKGKIFIKNKSKHENGIKHIELADDFGGELDIVDSKTVELVNVGRHASGHINLSHCDSIRALKFSDYFDGLADLSHSGIMYVTAQKGSNGRFILMNCNNLTLLKFTKDSTPTINVDRTPLEVAKDVDCVYYKFHSQKIPDEYFSSEYPHWLKTVKKFFDKQFHH